MSEQIIELALVKIELLSKKKVHCITLNMNFKILCYYHNQLCIFYWRILPYNPIIRSYNRIQDVIVLDLDLVQVYINMCYDQLIFMPLAIQLINVNVHMNILRFNKVKTVMFIEWSYI